MHEHWPQNSSFRNLQAQANSGYKTSTLLEVNCEIRHAKHAKTTANNEHRRGRKAQWIARIYPAFL